jgi:hypothetical protein
MFASVQTHCRAAASLAPPPLGAPMAGAWGIHGSCMGLLSLEQDIALVRADFAFYGLLVVVMAIMALATMPEGLAWQAAGWVLAGAAAWTLAEYALHRFVLHGVQPWVLVPHWRASALMLGVLTSYLAYIVTHHVVHHAHGGGRWLHHHKRWHALHHRAGAQACYGVSLRLWDHVFGSAGTGVRHRTDPRTLLP